LQYTGDTRIQSLISLYMTGDDRLMRKAILDFYHSRTPEGLTQGRYPSNRLQIIPPFSLFWISMIHDYWMYRRDDAFVKQFLPAINEILIWYKNRIDLEKQMLGPLSWWNFVDWDNFNGWGSAPGTESGNSSILSLQYAYTLQEASDLSEAFKHHDQAREYRRLARKLISGTFKNCYDSHRGLIADTPDKLTYSQHAGIWTILASKESNKFDQILMNNILTNKDIGQVTFFYRFYLNQALKKSGLAEKYIELLGPWKDMLKLGLTTFAEKPEPTRSDCHAWSASPNYDFLATICGITPASPGFRKVLIEPALGVISELSAQMPCPDGLIQLHIKKNRAAGLVAEITLPYPLKGIFKWNGMIRKLSSGKQQIKISHYKQ
jgi:alpha-L-rhamnosidase